MPQISTKYSDIAYSDVGPREAPVVMFGPGLLFGGWMFRDQITALSDRYRCLALDWPGQGDSPATSAGYDMDALTRDTRDIIHALDLPPVHWVGLSMGGFVGMRLAARHPELVSTLTLLNTTAQPAGGRGSAAAFRTLGLVQLALSPKWLVRIAAPTMFGPGFLGRSDSTPVLEEWASRLQGRNRAAVRQAVLGVAHRASIEVETTRIAAPTLVIGGADDGNIPPDDIHSLALGIPSARVKILDDCGHISCLEQPQAVSEELRCFIEEHTPRGRGDARITYPTS